MKDSNKWLDESKKRLMTIFEKKMKTVMIGALAAFEEKFAEELRDDVEFYDRFQQVRSDILNKGNDQIRNIGQELEQYDTNWKRYHMTLPVIPKKRGN